MTGSSICLISLTVSGHTWWQRLCFPCRIGSGGKHGPKTTSSTAEEWMLTETGKSNGVVSSITLDFSWNVRKIDWMALTHTAHGDTLTATWQGTPWSLLLMWSFLTINQSKLWIKYLCGDNSLCFMSFSLWWEAGGGFCWIIITPGGLWDYSWDVCGTDRHTEMWCEMRNREKSNISLNIGYFGYLN